MFDLNAPTKLDLFDSKMTHILIYFSVMSFGARSEVIAQVFGVLRYIDNWDDVTKQLRT